MALALFGGLVLAQTGYLTEGSFENSPALVVSNDRLQLTITRLGATFARIVLRDDPQALNPLWEPVRMARESGARTEFRGGSGHFVCVDGFGPVSPEERNAGLPGHGEAHQRQYELLTSGKDNRTTILTLGTKLPVVHEYFTRMVRLVDGENVVYVTSRLENLLGFDRPVNWAEHATVGSPFLEPGSTVVDVSGSWSMTRPYDQVRMGSVEQRLQSGKEFTWPLAPGLEGRTIDLRETPRQPHWLDHAATLVPASRNYGWTTALHKEKHLILGYLFRRDDFPWVQYWGSYPPNLKLARGLEFSTQPFDVPRREAVTTGSLAGTPTYRWLPANSTIETRFLMFYARVPEGMTKIDDVRLEDGRIVLEDRGSGTVLKLDASLGL